MKVAPNARYYRGCVIASGEVLGRRGGRGRVPEWPRWWWWLYFAGVSGGGLVVCVMGVVVGGVVVVVGGVIGRCRWCYGRCRL